MLLNDKMIVRRCEYDRLITPFEFEQVRKVGRKVVYGETVAPATHPVISFGLSSYGYDLRLGTEFKVFTNVNTTVVDPKDFDPEAFVSKSRSVGKALEIPPNSFVLGESLEYIKMPRDLLAICLGKSTYARCGIVVNVTPLEPEWEGKITIEISNTAPLPARVYAGEGIMQVLFFEADRERMCRISYKDRAGKYDKQQGIELPKV